MLSMRWVLPEYIQDVLPSEARTIEDLRRRLLDDFHLRGYQLVAPPLLEYLDSLLTGAGEDLAQRTYTLSDHQSGRLLGLRADMTPQVARIDAHLLNRGGVTRLCYCGSVLHSEPASLTATREPWQFGAEIYGHAGLDADIEIVRLLAGSLRQAGLAASRVDLGHMGIFRSLATMAALDAAQQQTLFALLQAKDVPTLREFLAPVGEVPRQALLALPSLYGDRSVLAEARRLLPDETGLRAALDELERLGDAIADLPLGFDLADLRGYHYHSGVVFAAYCGNSPSAIALGGRYDYIGAAFGRGRPATGFSMDLREIALRVDPPSQAGAVLAPTDGGAALDEMVARLRAAGEVVVPELPGHDGNWLEAGCDRRLALVDGGWKIVPLEGD